MNDSDETAVFRVFEVPSDNNGAPPRGSTPRADTIYPRTGTSANGAVSADADSVRFEPTVFGAARRYWLLVVMAGVLAMTVAIGYSVLQAKIYQAQATVTVPLPVSSTTTAADPGQYVDSQVVLLESQAVAQQAATIADRELGGNRLDAARFSTSKGGSLSVVPPTATSAGAYGASIVTVSFTGPNADVAQAGLKAILQAFDEAISSNIKAQANATIGGLDKAISANSSATQVSVLEAQRTQALVSEQANLAQTPTAAIGPTTLANGHWDRNGAIGLVVGLILGVGLAYALAVRRRGISGRQGPRMIYSTPIIAETPAVKALTGRQAHLPRRGLLPMAADPGSVAAEAFRFAANSVNRVRRAHGAGSAIAFVSPRADAGRSTVVANLALAMAEAGAKVLVVDANAGREGLTARLLSGGPVTRGFGRVLSGAQTLLDCVEPSLLNDRVNVLGADWTAQRIISGERAEALSSMLAVAKAHFDIVLIDCPALLQVADAFDVVSAADAAIVVVNSDDRLQDHLETAEVLRPMGVDILGYLYSRSPGRLRFSLHRPGVSRPAPGREAVSKRAIPEPPAPKKTAPIGAQLSNGNREPSQQVQD